MKKRLISLILFLALAVILSMIVQIWWVYCIVAFGVAFVLKLKPVEGLTIMAIGGILLWGGHAFLIDQGNDHLLSGRIASMLKMPSATVLLLVTAIIGGLTAALSGLSGSLLNRLNTKKSG